MGDEPLASYRSKRRAGRTPEPGVGAPPEPAVDAAQAVPPGPQRGGGDRRFVVQRHRARRLHYDLRFEIDGVLVSWAVPKGPPMDPKARHLAVHVEDHPLEYASFEGVIPAGEYGGGDVIVWDEGTWDPVKTDDPAAAVAAGELHAELYGHKLRGRLVLLRRDGPSAGHGKEQWLLLHKRDEHAIDGWDPEDHPASVVSGRTNEEVRATAPARRPRQQPGPAAPERLTPAAVGAPELVELAALGAAGTWDVAGRSLRLTNLDKVLFPGRPGEPPVTKRDLVAYAARVAHLVVPYLRDRPVNMHRFPDGADRPGFWHKQAPSHAPAWLGRWSNEEADEGETTEYLVINEPAGVVWMANFGALEWHAWTSTAANPHQPSYALIDIDPGADTTWEQVVELTRLYRVALEHLGVHGVPKLTGGRGVHIWVPIVSGYRFEDTRRWVEQLSAVVGKAAGDLVSWKWEKRARGGKARLDYTQNAINKTLVAPYSPRAAPGAPVSAPIRWEELDEPGLRSDRWTVRSVIERIDECGDLFASVLGSAQALPELG